MSLQFVNWFTITITLYGTEMKW